MTPEYENYKILRIQRAKEGEKRRQSALKDYKNAVLIANQVGWQLICHSEFHYSLRKPQENSWILNIYPGNRRIYYDHNKPQGPFLKLKDGWILSDVVIAAIEKNNANIFLQIMGQEKIRE